MHLYSPRARSFPAAEPKCRIKETDKPELATLWLDSSEGAPDFCELDGPCSMYAVCMSTLACPADGMNWESMMVGVYEGCKDLLPASTATFKDGPFGPKTSNGTDLHAYKREMCAVCFPKSPCSPKDVCLDNFDGSFTFTNERIFPGHPGRISCITNHSAMLDLATYPKTATGDSIQCDPASVMQPPSSPLAVSQPPPYHTRSLSSSRPCP